jgi:hypothetical protein
VTSDEAKAIIRQARPVAGGEWHELAIAADTLATWLRGLDRELEREQARAGWPVCCTERSQVRVRDEYPAGRMWLADAITTARGAVEDADEGRRPPPDLLEAARALEAYVEDRERDLAGERARVERAARADTPRVEGRVIVAGRDAGGRRDFRGGAPIEAGSTLYLLLERGWTATRYESNGGGPSLVYLFVPGAAAEMPITIPSDARFAWPREVRPNRGVRY